MKKFMYLIFPLMLLSSSGDAQVGISTDGTAPDPSAGLDVRFSDRGVLLPRLTVAQRNAIVSPAEGLMVFCTDCGSNGALSVYSGGAWRTYSLCTVPAPTAAANTLTPGQVTWRWNAVPGATGYKWGTTTNYSLAADAGNVLYHTETGTACGNLYTRYVWSYNSCGLSDMAPLFQSISPAAPAMPAAATHAATKTTIHWKWYPVAGANGYKWSATDNPFTAIDVGPDTSRLETALACETAYTRYVWAYNGCGYSNVLAINQSTPLCWVCGDSITIPHVAGSVAPVTVTITYGTVDSIPGEPSKCWISQNLGAIKQADSINDGADLHAGWYWQFDRKQGYFFEWNDPWPPVTPSWPAIYNNLDEDWQTANDPCMIELGSSWRIPTYTEWSDVFNAGNWFGNLVPWFSDLKMHAAGYLSVGQLMKRGQEGFYWSDTQSNLTIGWMLHTDAFTYNSIDGHYKPNGFTLRCLRD